MVGVIGSLADRLVSLVVPGVKASAAGRATCPSPSCSGACWCSQCAGGYAQKCCNTGGGYVYCRPCREGC